MIESKIKEEYKNISDTEFVPLKDGIDSVFLNKYEINKLGEIKTKFNNKITTNYNTTKIYPRKSFRHKDFKRTYFIHKLVALTFLENKNNYTEVDHIDRNPANYNVNNLRWVSRKENLKNRNPLSTGKNLYLVKLDDNKNEIEKLCYTELEKSRIDKINSAIRYGCKSEGYYWKRIDLELENFLKDNNIKENELVFKNTKYSNISISNNGVVKRGNILTIGWKDTQGYRKVSINKSPIFIHRLVYETFSNENINNYIIDHIDTNITNNNFSNLRKVTQKENMNNKITKKKFSKPTKKYSLDGEFIEEFETLTDACKSINLKRDNNTIQLCCDEKLITSHGYLWCYSGKEDTIERKLSILNKKK